MVYKCSVVTNFSLEFVDKSGWSMYRNLNISTGAL